MGNPVKANIRPSLGTISEIESFKDLQDLQSTSEPEQAATTSGRSSGVEDESGDQDSSIDDGGDAYAKAYSAIQAKKFAAAAKPSQGQSEASSSPDSISSDRSDALVFKMTAATEPLYGDEGEEEYWKAEEEY